MKRENNHSIELSSNALRILESRYLRRDSAGFINETPYGMFQRVARAVSKAELVWGSVDEATRWEMAFLEAMRRLQFLPNSPTLMNAGTAVNQLSACFVLPVRDHLEDIFASLTLAALIQQSGGGTGFNFSHLRPKNDPLFNTQGTASGPVSFMKIFDSATEHIRQGGKRRGANMGILNIDHPDISAFISSKQNEGAVRNFNISIGVTDNFMETLMQNGTWRLVHPNTHQVTGNIKAKSLWESIVYNAWLSGDPGLIFLDTINAFNPTPAMGRIEATNPCGEVPLLPYESCNLGSINISKFIRNNHTPARIDWSGLEKIISTAIRFLDDVIEVNYYLSPDIREVVQRNRKIGLGIMGWADALCQLEIPYESETAIQLASTLMKFVAEKSRDASMGLARERGTFRNWETSIYHPHTPVRNATRTSIAPTGTISIIADTSSSIEPFFALAYQRKHVLQDEVLEETNKTLLHYLEMKGLNRMEILSEIRESGTLEKSAHVSQHVKDIYKTALEIRPEWHVKHQAAFQRYTDNAVSKTINLPQQATPEDISEVYKNAWKAKLKGITVFRNNSGRTQVMHQGIASDIKSCKVCIE